MKVRRYYVGVFVEPTAYEMVSRFTRGERLRLVKRSGIIEVYYGETYIGNVRGKKRVNVGALFHFVDSAEAEFYNMNEKEGVMLIHVRINDEPYK